MVCRNDDRAELLQGRLDLAGENCRISAIGLPRSSILTTSRSCGFIAAFGVDDLQDLTDPGPVEADLASDGPIALALGTQGKDCLTKLGFIRIMATRKR